MLFRSSDDASGLGVSEGSASTRRGSGWDGSFDDKLPQPKLSSQTHTPRAYLRMAGVASDQRRGQSLGLRLVSRSGKGKIVTTTGTSRDGACFRSPPLSVCNHIHWRARRVMEIATGDGQLQVSSADDGQLQNATRERAFGPLVIAPIYDCVACVTGGDDGCAGMFCRHGLYVYCLLRKSFWAGQLLTRLSPSGSQFLLFFSRANRWTRHDTHLAPMQECLRRPIAGLGMISVAAGMISVASPRHRWRPGFEYL